MLLSQQHKTSSFSTHIVVNRACTARQWVMTFLCVMIVCRFRSTPLAAALDDCTMCLPGYVCSNASTFVPTACDSGWSCPLGSIEPQHCPAGSYCPPRTGDPLPCPASFYCPGNTSQPELCPALHYCPRGSMMPLLCPLGYRAINDSVNTSRSDLSSACRRCGPGYYSEVMSPVPCIGFISVCFASLMDWLSFFFVLSFRLLVTPSAMSVKLVMFALAAPSQVSRCHCWMIMVINALW